MGSNPNQYPYCEFPQDLYNQSNEPTSVPHLAKFMAIRIALLEQIIRIRSPHSTSSAILQQLISKLGANTNIQSPQRIIARGVHTLIAIQYYIDLNSSLIFCLFCHSSQSIIDVINGASIHQCILPQLIQCSKSMRFGSGYSV